MNILAGKPMNRFQSSNSPKSSPLFWARVKREQELAAAAEPKTDTIKQALNTIAGWASNYAEEQGQRNAQIRSEGR